MITVKTLSHSVFVLLVIMIVSCSTNDDSGDPQLFTTKFENSIWLRNDDVETSYHKVLNNESTPFRVWSRSTTTEECYYSYTIEYDGDVNSDYEILVNSENVFEVRITYYQTTIDPNSLPPVVQYFTYIINGNRMDVEERFFQEGELNSTNSWELQRQEINTDLLEPCE